MFHLAELNLARLRAPIDDPAIADFVAGLDPVNALADGAPGFVWRLQTESGNATDIHEFDDPLIILNLSVWESLEALRDYVYKTDHTDFLRRRREWFEPLEGPATILWWVPAGHVPTTAEALAKRDLLLAEGPTADAFSFRTTFPPPDELEATG